MTYTTHGDFTFLDNLEPLLKRYHNLIMFIMISVIIIVIEIIVIIIVIEIIVIIIVVI